jgi:hypothetical protein
MERGRALMAECIRLPCSRGFASDWRERARQGRAMMDVHKKERQKIGFAVQRLTLP